MGGLLSMVLTQGDTHHWFALVGGTWLLACDLYCSFVVVRWVIGKVGGHA